MAEVGRLQFAHIAPEGYLYVCLACGKTCHDRYSQEGGWDESCMLNSVLVKADHIVYDSYGMVREVQDGGVSSN